MQLANQQGHGLLGTVLGHVIIFTHLLGDLIANRFLTACS
jgi:hypothetical protein